MWKELHSTSLSLLCKVSKWTTGVYFTVKFILSVCALEASGFHSTLVYTQYWNKIGLETICNVTSHACRPASLNQLSSEHTVKTGFELKTLHTPF